MKLIKDVSDYENAMRSLLEAHRVAMNGGTYTQLRKELDTAMLYVERMGETIRCFEHKATN